MNRRGDHQDRTRIYRDVAPAPVTRHLAISSRRLSVASRHQSSLTKKPVSGCPAAQLGEHLVDAMDGGDGSKGTRCEQPGKHVLPVENAQTALGAYRAGFR